MQPHRMTRAVVLLAVATTVFTRESFAVRKTFDGHKMVTVDVRSAEQLEILRTLTDDIWSHREGIGPIDAHVTPEQFARLQASGLDFRVRIENLEPLVAAQFTPMVAGDFFTAYHPLDEVFAQVEQYAADYPSLATVVDFGTSLESRPMRGLRITGPGDGAAKPGFFFHGGQHAREWINIPVPLYVADWLLTNYGTDPLATRLVDEVEWHILPSMNPDGYEYSWTDNRFWRKNRRDNGNGSFGVDLNRNWGHGWGGPGSSSSPSCNTYRGPSPFSELETQALRDFVLAHPNIAAYIDFHNYSQLLMWPWGYTYQLAPDHDEFNTIGATMAQAIIDVHGMPYQYGPVYSTIYPASGGGADWVYGANLDDRIILAFAVELRDEGEFGFVLPPEQILPTCEENLPAVLDLADWISRSGPPLRVQILTGKPQLVPPYGATTVTARVTPRSGSFDDQEVSLFHRTDVGEFLEAPMSPAGNDLYTVVVPGADCESEAETFVVATSDDGLAVNEPNGAPHAIFSFAYGLPGALTVDDHEADSGWTVGDVGDTALSGAWFRADPNGTLAQPEDDHTTDSGTQCFVTGQGLPGGALGAQDVDGGKTTLVSPVIDLSNGDALVGYWRWFSNNTGSNPGEDPFFVDVSNDGGQSWVNVETIGPLGAQAVGGWFFHQFRVGEFVAPTDEIRVRFVALDQGEQSIVEAAIDDFEITSLTCPAGPIPAVSAWGIVTMLSVMLVIGVIILRSRSLGGVTQK